MPPPREEALQYLIHNLIENNKAMVWATTVRREFVKSLLAKKQAPKGWQYSTVHTITHHPETGSGYDGGVAVGMSGAKAEGATMRGWNPLRRRGKVHVPVRVLPHRADLRRA